jgi:large subunit ribosomal protein L30e
MTLEKDIRSAVKEKKIMIGSRGVLRAVRTGKLSGIVYARNTPRNTLNDINHYSGMSGITPQEYEGNSMQLGELVGKPFSVLLLGITK